jgi:hypothetical protein
MDSREQRIDARKRGVGTSVNTALVLALFAVGTGSCLEAPGYICASNDECIVNEVQGTCDLPKQTCVYPAGTACPSNYQDGAGNCVEPSPGFTSSSTSSTANSDTESSDADGSTSTSSSTSSSSDPSTTTDSGDATSTTGSGAPCDGAVENLTAFGVVGASSIFSGYPPGMSVDGELATSWFSTGPEGASNDQPSVFTWTLANPRCISRLFISGNGLNSNPDFREGYGFESVTFRVLDESMQAQFVQTRDLSGTPDPDVSVDVPGVIGVRVELEFSGHESPDCGGFSELQVLGGDV